MRRNELYFREKIQIFFLYRFIIQRMKIIDTRDIKFLTRNQEDKDTRRLTGSKKFKEAAKRQKVKKAC